jgi:hypothetical protein
MQKALCVYSHGKIHVVFAIEQPCGITVPKVVWQKKDPPAARAAAATHKVQSEGHSGCGGADTMLTKFVAFWHGGTHLRQGETQR